MPVLQISSCMSICSLICMPPVTCLPQLVNPYTFIYPITLSQLCSTYPRQSANPIMQGYSIIALLLSVFPLVYDFSHHVHEEKSGERVAAEDDKLPSSKAYFKISFWLVWFTKQMSQSFPCQHLWSMQIQSNYYNSYMPLSSKIFRF